MMSYLSDQLLATWTLSQISPQIRTALKNRDWKTAKRLLRQIRAQRRSLFEEHFWDAEIELHCGSHKRAATRFLKAQELNPCHPRPYIALLQYFSTKHGANSPLKTLIEKARKYCPDHIPLRQLIQTIEQQA